MKRSGFILHNVGEKDSITAFVQSMLTIYLFYGEKGDNIMIKWTIRIVGHPYVIDTTYGFSNMVDMERFVGRNDIQRDHIDEIILHENRKETAFLCEDVECVSAIRMLLVKKPK